MFEVLGPTGLSSRAFVWEYVEMLLCKKNDREGNRGLLYLLKPKIKVYSFMKIRVLKHVFKVVLGKMSGSKALFFKLSNLYI